LFVVLFASCSGKSDSGSKNPLSNAPVFQNSKVSGTDQSNGSDVKKENFISVREDELITVKETTLNGNDITITFENISGNTSKITIPVIQDYKDVTKNNGIVFGGLTGSTTNNRELDLRAFAYIYKAQSSAVVFIWVAISVGEVTKDIQFISTDPAVVVYHSDLTHLDHWYFGMQLTLQNGTRTSETIKSFTIENNAINNSQQKGYKFRYGTVDKS
jgi:hypothetical protein